MPEIKPKCENCEFYDEGKCTRFPPMIWGHEGVGFTAFPNVLKEHWCLEYRKSKERTDHENQDSDR